MNKVLKTNQLGSGSQSTASKIPLVSREAANAQTELQQSHLRAILGNNPQPLHTSDGVDKSNALASQIQIPISMKRQGTG
jgi:hypothetical protein